MNRFHALILLLPVVSLTLACGSSNRRLQSVSMTRTANGHGLNSSRRAIFPVHRPP
jgi:hypothetical protein